MLPWATVPKPSHWVAWENKEHVSQFRTQRPERKLWLLLRDAGHRNWGAPHPRVCTLAWH